MYGLVGNAQNSANYVTPAAGGQMKNEPADLSANAALSYAVDTLDRIEGLLCRIEDNVNGPRGVEAVEPPRHRPALRETVNIVNQRLSAVAERLSRLADQI